MTKNQWKPDTCGCVLEFEFDADAPDSERVVTPTQVVKACAHHPLGTTVKENYDKVLDENQRKNFSIKELVDQVPELKSEDIKFSFDDDRTLVLKLPGYVDKEPLVLSRIKSRIA